MVIGDVIGKPGRKCLKEILSDLKKTYKIDFVIANGENSAGGLGITRKAIAELREAGVDVITGGNHIWDNREIFELIDKEHRLLRPLNFAPMTPGKGYGVFNVNGITVAILNLAGRTFMPPVDCPFRQGKLAIKQLKKETSIIIIDFHAEATSEKNALGWFFAGEVTGILGTHTHVQTADERILPGGTAYISDIGMTGPANSVIGVDKDSAMFNFVSGLPLKLKVARANTVQLNAVVLGINTSNGKADYITRLNETYQIKQE